MSNEMTITEGQQPQAGAIAEAAGSRASQEVQAAMIVAKRFPRNETASVARIMTACKRKKLAEVSQYQYAKGGTKIVGPSIRLAEMMAQSWGNMDFGVIELESRHGESTMQAYCWDLETNTRSTKVFTVKHKRHTRGGSYELTDPREIYETNANSAARRMRACILAVIPGDIVDSAVEACNQTLIGGSDEPLIDRVRKMVSTFASVAVTQDMIEERLGHDISAVSVHQLVELGRIFHSIKDGMSQREQWFEIAAKKAADDLDQAAEILRARKETKKSKPVPAKPKDTGSGEFPEVEPVTHDELNEWDCAMKAASTVDGLNVVLDSINGHKGLSIEHRKRLVAACEGFMLDTQKGKDTK